MSKTILNQVARTDDAETEDKDEEGELTEKPVIPRLIFTEEQPEQEKLIACFAEQYKQEGSEGFRGTHKRTLFSGTAQFSEESKVQEKAGVKNLLDVESNEIPAKLVLTKRQKSDLLEAFNLLDYTGEGKILAEDFRVAIKALGYEPTKEELQKMVNAVDKGSTGKLSFENFETAIMRKIMLPDSEGDVMKSFRLFDMDDNGMISFDNLKKVSQVLGCYLTDEELDEMIDDADKDFDGLVSVQEFIKMIKNCVRIVTP